ncbi:MAG TPA: bacillithiol biosynthesis BshC [Thermoanaerobaculia bacterium]|nr:bacillithiol biosynthesis BshC [Thermoanaerobaculia bacterium]
MMTTIEESRVTAEFPLADYPSIGRFALDLVEGGKQAARFVRRPDWTSIAPSRPSRDREALAAALESANREYGQDVSALVRPWMRGEAVAIVAGQQVGVGGGPLYTLAKIASLIAIRRRLAQRGIAATPFFWLATEDHDVAEVSRVLVQKDGEHRWIAPTSDQPRRCPVGPLSIPEEVRASLAELAGDAAWLRPGISYGESFARLVVEAVGEGEIVLIDSLLPELRRSGRDLMVSLAAVLGDVEQDLDQRSAELRAGRFEPQVTKGREGHYSLLYAIDDKGERVPILPREEAFTLAEKRRSHDDVIEWIRSSPERISTGVLARPLLQDWALEPSVFVGGPAEVAYYAQLLPLHSRFRVAPPSVALRGHVLVAPAKRLRALDRHGLDVTALFGPLEQRMLEFEPEASAGLEEIMENAERSLEGASSAIADLALQGDPGLERAMRRSRRKIAYHLGVMRGRGERAVARRDAERWAAVTRLQQILYPENRPQDRVAGWIGWWSCWGTRLVSRMIEEAEPDSPIVRVAGVS